MLTVLVGQVIAAATLGMPASADRCAAVGGGRADRTARARPLGEMPPARPVLTVYRRVGGCAVILVRDGGRIVEEPPRGDPYAQAVSASRLRI